MNAGPCGGAGRSLTQITHDHVFWKILEDTGRPDSVALADLVDKMASAIERPSQTPLTLSPTVIELHEAKRFSELIGLLAIDPDKVKGLTPRQFEELTAEVFHRLGHEVDLTSAQGDGGFDLAVRVRNGVSRHLLFREEEKARWC